MTSTLRSVFPPLALRTLTEWLTPLERAMPLTPEQQARVQDRLDTMERLTHRDPARHMTLAPYGTQAEQFSPQWNPREQQALERLLHLAEATQATSAGMTPEEAVLKIPEFHLATMLGRLPLQDQLETTRLMAQLRRKGTRSAEIPARLQEIARARAEGAAGQISPGFADLQQKQAAPGAIPLRQAAFQKQVEMQPQIDEWYKKTAQRAGIPVERLRSLVPTLSTEQFRYVQHARGASILSSGPGSGKTTTLAAQFIDAVINRRADPTKLVMTSMTHSGVMALQDIFARVAEVFHWKLPPAQTVHSLAYQHLTRPSIEGPSGSPISPLEAMGKGNAQLLGYGQTRADAPHQPRNAVEFVQQAERSTQAYLATALYQKLGARVTGTTLDRLNQSIATAKGDPSVYRTRMARGKSLYASRTFRAGGGIDPDAALYVYEAALRQRPEVKGGIEGQTTPRYDLADAIRMARQSHTLFGYPRPGGSPYIAADEYQDMSHEQLHYLAALAQQPGGQIHFAGDLSQRSISGGARADQDAKEILAALHGKEGFSSHRFHQNFRSPPHVVALMNAMLATQGMTALGRSPYQISMQPGVGTIPTAFVGRDYPQVAEKMVSDAMSIMGLTFAQIGGNLRRGRPALYGARVMPQEIPFIHTTGAQRNAFLGQMEQMLTQKLGPSLGIQAFGEMVTTQTPSRGVTLSPQNDIPLPLFHELGDAINTWKQGNVGTMPAISYDAETRPVSLGPNPDRATDPRYQLHALTVTQARSRGYDYPLVNVTRAGAWGPAEFLQQLFTAASRAQVGLHLYGAARHLPGTPTHGYDLTPESLGGTLVPHGFSGLLTRAMQHAVTVQGVPRKALPRRARALLGDRGLLTPDVIMSGETNRDQGVLQEYLHTVGSVAQQYQVPAGGGIPAMHPATMLEKSYDDEAGAGDDRGILSGFLTGGQKGGSLNAALLAGHWTQGNTRVPQQAYEMVSRLARQGPTFLESMGLTEPHFLQKIGLPEGFSLTEGSPAQNFEALIKAMQLQGKGKIPQVPVEELIPNEVTWKELEHVPSFQNISEAEREKQQDELKIGPWGDERKLSRLVGNLVKYEPGFADSSVFQHYVRDLGALSPESMMLHYPELHAGVQKMLEDRKDLARLQQFRQGSVSPQADMVRDLEQRLQQTQDRQARLSPRHRGELDEEIASLTAQRGRLAGRSGLDALFTDMLSEETYRQPLTDLVTTLLPHGGVPLPKEFIERLTGLAQDLGMPSIAHHLQSYAGPVPGWQEGITFSAEELAELERTDPREGKLMRLLLTDKQQLLHSNLNDPAVQANIAQLSLFQSQVVRKGIKTPEEGERLGVSLSETREEPMQYLLKSYVNSLQDYGVVDPHAVQMQPNGRTLSEGGGVSLSGYITRMRDMLAHSPLSDEQKASMHAELTQVSAMQGQLTDPDQLLQWGHTLNTLMLASTGQGTSSADTMVSGPSYEFFGPLKSDVHEGTRTLSSVHEFVSAIGEASQFIQNQGGIKREHLVRVLHAMGHDPESFKMLALHPGFAEPSSVLSLDTLAGQYASNRNLQYNVMQQTTRAPLLPGKQYQFMGGTEGYPDIVEAQRRLGMTGGVTGTLLPWGKKTPWGTPRTLKSSRAEYMLTREEFTRHRTDPNPDRLFTVPMRLRTASGRIFPVRADQLQMLSARVAAPQGTGRQAQQQQQLALPAPAPAPAPRGAQGAAPLSAAPFFAAPPPERKETVQGSPPLGVTRHQAGPQGGTPPPDFPFTPATIPEGDPQQWYQAWIRFKKDHPIPSGKPLRAIRSSSSSPPVSVPVPMPGPHPARTRTRTRTRQRPSLPPLFTGFPPGFRKQVALAAAAPPSSLPPMPVLPPARASMRVAPPSPPIPVPLAGLLPDYGTVQPPPPAPGGEEEVLPPLAGQDIPIPEQLADTADWLQHGNPTAGFPVPSAEQMAVLHAPGYHTIIEGGPGSGKTDMLTSALGMQITQGLLPAHTLSFSALRSGVAELAKRYVGLRKILPSGKENEAYQLPDPRTFHSLAASILFGGAATHPDTNQIYYPTLAKMGMGDYHQTVLENYSPEQIAAMTPENRTIAQDTRYGSQRAFLEQVMGEAGFVPPRSDQMWDYLSHIQKAKKNREGPGALYATSMALGAQHLGQGALTQEAALQLYEQALSKEGIFDYESLIHHASRAMEQQGGEALPSRYRQTETIALDEGQDMTPLQMGFLKNLMGALPKTPRLLVGMDRAQSLLQSMGGIDVNHVLESYQQMLMGHGTLSHQLLTTNFRSDRAAVAFNNAVLRHPSFAGAAKSPPQVPFSTNLGQSPHFVLAKNQQTLYRQMARSMLHTAGVSFPAMKANIDQGQHPFAGINFSAAGRVPPSQVPAIVSMNAQRELFERNLEGVLQEELGIDAKQARAVRTQIYRRDTPSAGASPQEMEDAQTQFWGLKPAGSRSWKFQNPHIDVTQVGRWDKLGWLRNLFVASSRVGAGGQNSFFAASHPLSSAAIHAYLKGGQLTDTNETDPEAGEVRFNGMPVAKSGKNAFETMPGGRLVPHDFTQILKEQQQILKDWKTPPADIQALSLGRGPRTINVAEADTVHISMPSSSQIHLEPASGGPPPGSGPAAAALGGGAMTPPPGVRMDSGRTAVFSPRALMMGPGGRVPPPPDDKDDDKKKKKPNYGGPFNNMPSNVGRTFARIGYEMNYLSTLLDQMTMQTAVQGSEYRRATVPLSGGTGTEGFYDFTNPQSGMNRMQNQLPMYSKVQLAQDLHDLAAQTATQVGGVQGSTSILALAALAGMDPTALMSLMTTAAGSTPQGYKAGTMGQIGGALFQMYGGVLSQGNVQPTLESLNAVLPTVQGLQLGGPSQIGQVMSIFNAAIGGGMTAGNLPAVANTIGSLAQMGSTPTLQQQYLLNQLYPGQTTANPELQQFYGQQIGMQQQIAQLGLQMNINGQGLSLPRLEIQIAQADINLQNANLQMAQTQLAYGQAGYQFGLYMNTQQYGPIGADVSRNSYFDFMRRQQVAGYDPLSPETGTTFKSSPVFGLQNAQFYAGIENQRQMSILGRSPLLSDAAFQQQQKYLNLQEAFYHQELALRNQQRTFDMIWQKKLLDAQANALSYQQKSFALDVIRNQYEQKSLAITEAFLPQQLANQQAQLAAMQQFISGQGPVNGKNLQPADIIRQLVAVTNDQQLRQDIQASRLPLDQQNTLFNLIKDIQKRGGLDKIQASQAKSDKDLMDQLNQLIKAGGFTDVTGVNTAADAFLQWGGKGGTWDQFAANFVSAKKTWEDIAKTLSSWSPVMKNLDNILKIAGPVMIAMGAFFNTVGFLGGLKTLAGLGPGTGVAGGGMGFLPTLGIFGLPLLEAGIGAATYDRKAQSSNVFDWRNILSLMPGFGAGNSVAQAWDWFTNGNPKTNGDWWPFGGGQGSPNDERRRGDKPINVAVTLGLPNVPPGTQGVPPGGKPLTPVDIAAMLGLPGGSPGGKPLTPVNIAAMLGLPGGSPGVKPLSPVNIATMLGLPNSPGMGGANINLGPTKKGGGGPPAGKSPWDTIVADAEQFLGIGPEAKGKHLLGDWFNGLVDDVEVFLGVGSGAKGKHLLADWWNGLVDDVKNFLGINQKNDNNFFADIFHGLLDNIQSWLGVTVTGPNGAHFLSDEFDKLILNIAQFLGINTKAGTGKGAGFLDTIFNQLIKDIETFMGMGGKNSTGNFFQDLMKMFGMGGGGNMPFRNMPSVNHGGFITPPVNADFHRQMAYGIHQGVDFAADQGTPLSEFIGGTVENTGFYPWGGEVDMNIGMGLTERYLHLSSIGVRAGQHVRQGQYLGLTGGGTVASGLGKWSSGAHSHVQYDMGNINQGINPWTIWAMFGDMNLRRFYGINGGPGGPAFGQVGGGATRLPLLASGGIAMRPLLAGLGEQPEAIIPLSKLRQVMAQTGRSGSGGGGGTGGSLAERAQIVVSKLVEKLEIHVHTSSATLDEAAQDDLMAQTLTILSAAISQLLGKL